MRFMLEARRAATAREAALASGGRERAWLGFSVEEDEEADGDSNGGR